MNRTFLNAVLSVFVVLAAAAPALAGGVRSLPIASIPFARSPIPADGTLAGWPDGRSVRYLPLDLGLDNANVPSADAVRRMKLAASIQTCYDKEALYIAVRWSGDTPEDARGKVQIAICTDRSVDIRLADAALGVRTGGQVRNSADSDWREVPGLSSESIASGSDIVQEIRVPWATVDETGEPPLGNINIALKFRWPALTSTLLKQLPPDIRHDNMYTTMCFLTSPAKALTHDVYLGSPSDWGLLRFADQTDAPPSTVSPDATGLSELRAERVGAPLPINGSLDGWSSNAFVPVAYSPELLGNRYSASIAVAYDDNYLYVAAQYISPGGPLNSKGEVTQAGYAGGDCLQIRLNDGVHTVNLCGWYDSTAGKPALTADGNDLANPYLLDQGAKEAFEPSPDGAGYSQELAIPWRLLSSAGAPRPGTAWKATFQPWWSGLSPEFVAMASPQLERPGGIPVPYNIAAESNVTVAVFDKHGALVRTLAKDMHRYGGKNTEYWDGRDQYGKVVEPGDYEVRGLSHPPINLHYLLTAGNPGTPPWPTTDGTGDWLSDESAPQAAVTDGKTVYLAAPGSEKGYSIVAVGPDGKRLWGYQEPANPRCVSLAISGPNLYVLYSGPELTDSSSLFNGTNAIGRAYVICIDRKTGQLTSFSLQHPRLKVATWPYVDRCAGLWSLRTQKKFSPATYGGQIRYWADDIGEPTNAIGLAAQSGKLYVSLFEEDRLLVVDATTGKATQSIPLKAPAGLCATPDGNLLAVSDGQIVRVDLESNTTRPIVTTDLEAPDDVTVDGQGNIYVSDWAASFQVKVFSPNGKFLRAIGKPGGRPWTGPWEPGGMLVPRGVAVTSKGELWVAEDDSSPCRVSVWNTHTGGLIRDYIGPTSYGGGGPDWIDPNDPTLLCAEGLFWRVDWATKTVKPLATAFRRMTMDEPFELNPNAGIALETRVVEHDGKRYLFHAGGFSTVIYRMDGLRLVPVAAVGCLHRWATKRGDDLKRWDSDIGNHFINGYYPPFFAGHQGENYVWTDRNGDGKVQPDEMTWSMALFRNDSYVPGTLAETLTGWDWGVSKEGTLYFSTLYANDGPVSRVDIQSWTPSGAPVYDLSTAKTIWHSGGAWCPQGIYVSDAGNVYLCQPYESAPGETALDCLTADGDARWSFAMPTRQQQIDDVESDRILGEFHTRQAGDVLATWLWHANAKSYLVTSDGLYITGLLDDTSIGPSATWGESYRSVCQGPDGQAYLVNGANDALHIFKIEGLDDIARFSAPLIVTADQLASVAQTKAPPAAPLLPKPIIRIAWGEPSLTDGVKIAGTGERSARVALSRDAQTLHAEFEVHDSQMVNKGNDWQQLFITGDCVDVMLSTGDAVARAHYQAMPGDERILLSLYRGKPVAVLFRPVVPGTTAPVRFMAAMIDQVVLLKSAAVDFERTQDGYTAHLSVPLADLGIDPASTTPLRGDVGVIFADATGSNRVERDYYYNKHTSMVNDLTTEATLQPGEWGEVDMALGPNLLKNGDFSEPLAGNADAGWFVSDSRNGDTVLIDDSGGYGSDHDLFFNQTTPVIFADDAYKMPDYGAYLKSANGGKGGGGTVVSQTVAVTGGKKYHLRVHFWSSGLQPEVKDPKPGRGYAALEIWIYWQGGRGGATWVANEQADPQGWKTIYDVRFPNDTLSRPFLAPDGATGAAIAFSTVSNAAGSQPRIRVSDVEFVPAD